MALTYTDGPWGDTDGAIDLEAGTSCVILPQDGNLPDEFSISALVSFVGMDPPAASMMSSGPYNLSIIRVLGSATKSEIGVTFSIWGDNGNGTGSAGYVIYGYPDGTEASPGNPSYAYHYKGPASALQLFDTLGSDNLRWAFMTLVKQKASVAGEHKLALFVQGQEIPVYNSTQLEGVFADTGDEGIVIGQNFDESYISCRVASVWVHGRAITLAEHTAAYNDLASGTDNSVLPPEED